MPQYTVQSPSGKQVTIEGDAPPTEQDLNQIFGQVGDSTPASSKSLKYSDMEANKNQGTPLGVGEIVPGLARGVVQGGQEMLNTAANVNDIVGKPIKEFSIGSKRYQDPHDLVAQSKAALDMLLPPSDSIAGKVSEGFGQLPGMVTTYGAIPESKVLAAAGVLGAINSPGDGVQGRLKGATGNMLMMALLSKAQALKDPLKAAALGAATSGSAAALSGDSSKDIIAQSALGAGFSLYPEAQHERIKKDFDLAKQFMQDPKGNAKEVFNVLKEDPVQRVMRKINDGEAQLKTDLAAKNSDLSQAQRVAMENAKNLTSDDLKAIEGMKTEAQKRADAQKKQIEQDRAIEVARLQNEQDKFLSNMPDNAEAKAKYIQNNYKEFFGQATKQYGEQLDATALKIGDISKENAFAILGNALDKSINDYGSSDTTFAKKIMKLQEKYNPESSMGGQLKELTASMTPEAIAKLKADNPSLVGDQKPVGFKDFYSDVKNLLKTMEPSEHNASILRREIGEYVKKVDPSFQELQDEYSHVVSYKEELAKIFHPYDGPAALKSGEKWLTEFGMGNDSNLTNTDRNMLRFMEEGFTGKKLKMQGIGTDTSTEFKALGDKIDTIKRGIQQAKDPIFSKYAMEIAQNSQDAMREMAALDAKGQLSKEQLDLKMAHIKEVIAQAKSKAILDIEMKKRIYEKARHTVQRLDMTRKRIEGFASAFGFGVAGAGLFKASRIFRATLMARKAMRIKGMKR